MFVVWVFEAMYLWTAINLNVQSHLIVLKGAFWIPSVVVIGIFFFSFCLSIFHLIYFALTMYGNSTHIHTVTFIHTTKGTNRKCKTKQDKKRRHHHSNGAVAAASYFSITFVCGRALLFSCHSPLSWHIRYQVQCVYTCLHTENNGSLPVHPTISLIWLMTNGRKMWIYWRIFMRFGESISIDTIFSMWWETLFSYSLGNPFFFDAYKEEDN